MMKMEEEIEEVRSQIRDFALGLAKDEQVRKLVSDLDYGYGFAGMTFDFQEVLRQNIPQQELLAIEAGEDVTRSDVQALRAEPTETGTFAVQDLPAE